MPGKLICSRKRAAGNSALLLKKESNLYYEIIILNVFKYMCICIQSSPSPYNLLLEGKSRSKTGQSDNVAINLKWVKVSNC